MRPAEQDGSTDDATTNIAASGELDELLPATLRASVLQTARC